MGDAAFTVAVGEISPVAQSLLEVTEQSLYVGIEQMRAGNRTGDISAAIQKFVESNGFHVTREYTGHGVGRQMHEGPQVPNYGTPGRGVLLRPGMTIALEPMVLVGTHRTRVLADQWTVVSADGSLTAHYEHSVAVTDGDPLNLDPAVERLDKNDKNKYNCNFGCTEPEEVREIGRRAIMKVSSSIKKRCAKCKCCKAQRRVVYHV